MSKRNREKRQWKQREMKAKEHMEAYKQRQQETMDALERGEIEWWQLDAIEGNPFSSLQIGV